MNDSWLFESAALFFHLAQAQAVTPWVSNAAALGAWLGVSAGIFGGAYGTVVGTLAPRGAAKPLVFAMHWGGLLAGIALLVTGVFALISGQPYGVWYGFGLSGLILTVVIGALTPVVRMRYREAEQRQLEAEGFRRE